MIFPKLCLELHYGKNAVKYWDELEFLDHRLEFVPCNKTSVEETIYLEAQ